jgi:hypothetical protein
MTVSIKNLILTPFNLLYNISPEITLKILFRLKLGYNLNLKDPQTYNEKLQWLKLNYKNPLLTKLVDKYTVREYVSSKCPEILNILYWSGFNPKQIPWDTLPNKFVIKVTHGSGFNIICTDKNKLDKMDVERKLSKWLKTKYLKCYGEWFYGIEKPRIIIEEFLESDDEKTPTDYKILCFNGEPKFIAVHTNRFTRHIKNIYDTEWNLKKGYRISHEPDGIAIEKPRELDRMLDCARRLSQGFPHVRVDLYFLNSKVYFGELTFISGSGFGIITPHEFDYELGRLITLHEQM